jgi:hypothetical protein
MKEQKISKRNKFENVGKEIITQEEYNKLSSIIEVGDVKIRIAQANIYRKENKNDAILNQSITGVIDDVVIKLELHENQIKKINVHKIDEKSTVKSSDFINQLLNTITPSYKDIARSLSLDIVDVLKKVYDIDMNSSDMETYLMTGFIESFHKRLNRVNISIGVFINSVYKDINKDPKFIILDTKIQIKIITKIILVISYSDHFVRDTEENAYNRYHENVFRSNVKIINKKAEIDRNAVTTFGNLPLISPLHKWYVNKKKKRIGSSYSSLSETINLGEKVYHDVRCNPNFVKPLNCMLNSGVYYNKHVVNKLIVKMFECGKLDSFARPLHISNSGYYQNVDVCSKLKDLQHTLKSIAMLIYLSSHENVQYFYRFKLCYRMRVYIESTFDPQNSKIFRAAISFGEEPLTESGRAHIAVKLSNTLKENSYDVIALKIRQSIDLRHSAVLWFDASGSCVQILAIILKCPELLDMCNLNGNKEKCDPYKIILIILKSNNVELHGIINYNKALNAYKDGKHSDIDMNKEEIDNLMNIINKIYEDDAKKPLKEKITKSEYKEQRDLISKGMTTKEKEDFKWYSYVKKFAGKKPLTDIDIRAYVKIIVMRTAYNASGISITDQYKSKTGHTFLISDVEKDKVIILETLTYKLKLLKEYRKTYEIKTFQFGFSRVKIRFSKNKIRNIRYPNCNNKSGNSSTKLYLSTLIFDKVKDKNASLANRIHFRDSQILNLTIYFILEERPDLKIRTCHDEFRVHPNNADLLIKCYNKAILELYKTPVSEILNVTDEIEKAKLDKIFPINDIDENIIRSAKYSVQ